MKTVYGLVVDVTRGFDVLKGKKELAHFDTYEEARAYADAERGRWIRYWLASES